MRAPGGCSASGCAVGPSGESATRRSCHTGGRRLAYRAHVAHDALPTPFAEEVLDVVAAIPAGQVMAYSDVAAVLGRGGPRQVGQALARFGSGVPWWRVLRSRRLVCTACTVVSRWRDCGPRGFGSAVTGSTWRRRGGMP